MTRGAIPIVLSIAGTDPTAGAGIQADIKAISATGGYAATAITALVAQNTQGVIAIEAIDDLFFQTQLDAIGNDLCIKAIKIGMLHDENKMSIVADFIDSIPGCWVVLDPVMVAKDGSCLMPATKVTHLIEKLLPKCHLVTPNLHEAEQLIQQPLKTPEDMANAAQSLGSRLSMNVLIKGGHLDHQSQASDVLYQFETGDSQWFHQPRIDSRHTHGTGCSLSAAIASYLAQGEPLTQAIQLAKAYLFQAIEGGQTLAIGKGNGPVDHFFHLQFRKEL